LGPTAPKPRATADARAGGVSDTHKVTI